MCILLVLNFVLCCSPPFKERCSFFCIREVCHVHVLVTYKCFRGCLSGSVWISDSKEAFVSRKVLRKRKRSSWTRLQFFVSFNYYLPNRSSINLYHLDSHIHSKLYVKMRYGSLFVDLIIIILLALNVFTRISSMKMDVLLEIKLVL